MASSLSSSSFELERSGFRPAEVLEGLFASAVLFVASGAVFPLLRRLGGEGTVQVNPPGKPEGAIYALAFLTTAILCVPLRRRLFEAVRGDSVLWALPATAALSVFWSTDSTQTLRSSVSLTGSMLFGAYFALRFEVRTQLRILALTCGLILLVSIASALVEPYLGIDRGLHAGAWRGIFGHKNLFGRACALAVSVFLILTLHRPDARVYSTVLAATSVALVWLSRSRTALVVVLGVVVFATLRPILRRVTVRGWMIAVLMVSAIFTLAVVVWSHRQNVIVRDPEAETLTGRTVLWAVSILKLGSRPLFGYGFDAFWNGRAGNYYDVWQLVGWHAPNAHNGFIDVALDLGVTGFLLFLIVCIRVLTRTLSLHRDPRLSKLEQSWPSTLAVFVLLAFVSEGQLLFNHAYWMLFTSAAVFASTIGDRESEWQNQPPLGTSVSV